MSGDLARAAFLLAMRGLPVYPLAPGTKVPLAGSHGYKDASSDPDVARARWAKTPQANIGVATGPPSRIWVQDVDAQHNGIETLDRLEADYGPLPETVKILTPSGGFHLWWCRTGTPEIRNSVGRVGPGIDVRGLGGSAIAPPSMLADGRCYRWAPDSGGVIADAPDWLTTLTWKPEPPIRPAPRPLGGDCSRYVGASAAAELRDLESASEGCRNATLNRAAFALAGFVLADALPEDWARSQLEARAVAIGLPVIEARRTIESAFAAAQPREIPR